MQRQRGEWVPIGEVIADLDGPVTAIRDASPQARRSFTVADQVNLLVSASEADADLGFMARMMALCSLPRTNPGNRTQYKRVNGPYKLIMFSSGETKLPFGNLPRLILAWVTTEAVRTQSRVLVLGDSLSEFMRELGVYSNSGRVYTRLRNQMNRLFHSSVELVYEHEHGEQFMASRVVDRGEFWWNPKRPNERMLWDSKIELGEKFFNEIIRHPVPLDLTTLKALKRLSAGPRSLHVGGVPDLQFEPPHAALLAATLPAAWGDPSRASDNVTVQRFRKDCPARVEEDQAGLAGLELLDRSGPPDPASLDSDDRSGGCVATAGPIASQEAPGVERHKAGVLRRG